jgi:hypothetical protein
MSENLEGKKLDAEGQEKKSFGAKVGEAVGKVAKGVKGFIGKTWKFAAGAGVALAVKAFLDSRADASYDEIQTDDVTTED